jgi:hypothetical protein
VRILREGRCGLRFTGKPASLPVLQVRNDGLRFLRWRSCIGLGLLLRQWTRRDDDKAPDRLRAPPLPVLHAALFQPFPHLIESMMPIQKREDQVFDPATTREPVCWVGG